MVNKADFVSLDLITDMIMVSFLFYNNETGRYSQFFSRLLILNLFFSFSFLLNAKASTNNTIDHWKEFLVLLLSIDLTQVFSLSFICMSKRKERVVLVFR